MTRDEIKKVLKRLANNHPSFFRDKTSEDLTEMVNEWYVAFNAVPIDLLNKAIYIQEQKSQYMPSVNDLKQRFRAMYYTAVGNLSYYTTFYKEEYDGLLDNIEREMVLLRRYTQEA